MDSKEKCRKRKSCEDVVEEEDDDEETKIEKFFELIQGLREARERLIMNHNNAEKKKHKNNNKSIENKNNKGVMNMMMKGCVPVWEPRFQLEDFAQEAKDLMGVPFSNTGKPALRDHHKQETNQGLDLTLSL